MKWWCYYFCTTRILGINFDNEIQDNDLLETLVHKSQDLKK